MSSRAVDFRAKQAVVHDRTSRSAEYNPHWAAIVDARGEARQVCEVGLLTPSRVASSRSYVLCIPCTYKCCCGRECNVAMANSRPPTTTTGHIPCRPREHLDYHRLPDHITAPS